MQFAADMKASSWRKLLEKQSSRDKTYLLSNNGFFLFRFANGAFGSKWCGVWDVGKKLIEYFAFKVDGEWLSPENFHSLEYDGVKAVHRYGTHLGEVTEQVVVGKSGLFVKVSIPKTVRCEVEVAANIRYRDEDIHGRGYSIGSGKDTVVVSNNVGSVKIEVSGSEFLPFPRKEIHTPGRYALEQGYDWQEGEQEKFIPGLFRLRGRTVNLWLGYEKENLRSVVAALRKRYRAKSVPASKLAPELAVTLSQFFYSRDAPGVIAGFPYFNEFWTRDFLYMFKPLLMAGFEKEAFNALKSIASSQLENGAIPMIVPGDRESADSTPLFLLAVHDYVKFTGSKLGSLKKPVLNALSFGLESLEDGLVQHDPKLTWMDTLHRKYAVEVESLWAVAFTEWGKILKNEKVRDAAKAVRSSVLEYYPQSGFFVDSLEGKYRFTVNSLIPPLIAHMQIPDDVTYQKFLNELKGEFGVRAVSRLESGDEYHARIWGLSTYFGLRYLARYDENAAKILLSNWIGKMGVRTVGGIPETFTEAGYPLGASHQLWSQAFIPEILLALDGVEFNSRFRITPGDRTIRIGGWRITVRREEG